eukprot:586391_1
MGVCAAGIQGNDAPEIDVDEEQLQDLIKTQIEEIPDKVRENCDNFPIEIQNADPNEYVAPDTDIKLNKDTPLEEIAMAAIESAFGETMRNKIKKDIWTQLESQIEEQLNECDASDKLKKNAKDHIVKQIDEAVDAQMNDALETMKQN